MRIAIVGGGVTGLVAARRFAAKHEVVLFEAQDRLGGHAHTHDVEVGGRRLRVDTGFMVFNRATYPGFVALLDELGVGAVASDMALSVRCRRCGLEYALRSVASVLAQPSNLLRPSFHRMFRDLFRFFREARAWLAASAPDAPSPAPDVTVRTFLQRGGYGDGFVRHWLLPTAGAVWSAPFGGVLDSSARMLLGFFDNHGFLRRRQLPWLTVAGGSRAYVEAVARDLGPRARTSSAVRAVRRDGGGVTVEVAGRPPERFDHVVLACHADEALALLPDADDAERALLARFPYARHRVVLHTDASFLPRRRRAWSAWNCDVADCRDDAAPASLTYHLNRLQNLPGEVPVCVTLNPSREPAGVLRELAYAHPTLTADAVAAQDAVAARNGARRTWFAGAHLRHGFHEDGLVAATRVVAAIDALGARS